MSDPNNFITPEQQIKLLEKALIRERNTKKILEEKLEQRAQEKFEHNKELLFAVEQAKDRQVQFQFLTTLTQELLSTQEIDTMCNNFIHRLASFMENCPALQICVKVNEGNSISRLPQPTEPWQSITYLPCYQPSIDNLFKQDELIWHRHERTDEIVTENYSDLLTLLKNNTLLYLVLNISNLQKRIIILDVNHYCYSDDFKETLNIAGKQFSLAIKRQVAKDELSYNFEVLKNVLADLETSQRQLIQNEKMASLGQLSAGIAHEINNPIGYIASNFETLLEYISTYEQVFKQLNKENFNQMLADEELNYIRNDIVNLTTSCIDGVERISEIVKSLKSFSRKEEDKYQEVDINDVINSSLKMVWNNVKYHHKVNKQLLTTPPKINANHGQLQQVFINLFVNAIHAMDHGGEITITTVIDKNCLQVAVKDTGHGMSESVTRKIFEPFFTTKAENEGTGLGLSVSYAIIEKHNATIDVQSHPKLGTCFIIRFPIKKE